MTIYHTYIDDNVGLSSSTIAGIQTNGSTYGVGISSNGYFSGIVTASSFVGDGSKLTEVTVTQVSTGTTTGITTYYPTFVDSNNSTRDNKFLYTDAGISYNPSTNSLGIGTANPKASLDVVYSKNDIILSTGAIPNPGIILQNSGGDGALWLGNDNRVSASLGVLVNNGSVIDLSGKYSSIDISGNVTFGRIGAFKENNTSGDYSGYLSLYSRSPSSGGILVEALRIDSSQRVGIGTTNPTSKLHVSGNVTVTGSVSKGSGSFVIDHPLNETKNLVHSFVEGPRADLIYRGTVSLIDGSATINLDEEYELIPGTWKALCRNPQVWISNIDGWTKCRGTVEDGILIIEAQTASNESVNWLVIAERKDKHMYDTGWTDDNGRPILEPVKL